MVRRVVVRMDIIVDTGATGERMVRRSQMMTS